MANTLKFGNGKWAVKDGSALAYNDTNGNFKPLPFTFVRDTGATRVNKQGLIEVVPNNEPRIDFLNDSNGALLLEPSRSNIALNSSDWSGSGWIIESATVTNDETISPNGSEDAELLTLTGTFGRIRQNFSSLSDNTVYTFSSFFKAGTAYSFKMIFFNKANTASHYTFNLQEGTSDGGGIIEYYGNGWYRCSFSSDSESGVTTPTIRFASHNSGFTGGWNTGLTIYAWGAQAEQGSYATSYIPTQGGLGTRDAESSEQTPPDGIIGQTEGTLFVDVKSDNAEGAGRLIAISDGTPNNRIMVRYSSNDLLVYAQTTTQQWNYTFSRDENMKIGIAYANNDAVLYVNGVALNSLNAFNVPSCNKVFLGTPEDGGSSVSNVKINDFKLYNIRLSNAELQALTKI